MKKYLMTGVAALALCAGFTSCSHDEDFETYSQAELIKNKYETAFVNAFGQPAADQDWGFGATSNARMATRAAVVDNNIYSRFVKPTDAEIAAAFPSVTDIPSNAIEVSTIAEGWSTWSNDNNKDFIVTPSGKYEIGATYYNNDWSKIKNIYVNASGNTTIVVNGLRYANIYIMQGNVTIENKSQFGGLISVAEGATFTYNQSEIADNDKIRVFNRGTIKFTANAFDIGNNAAIYNEGTISAKDLSYSPADASKSFFINMTDDSKLYASSMTINSTGNMLNQGRMMIQGLTKITQAGCFWVNAGHYHTGSMEFMAKNEDWYNYCQLFVDGNIHFFDGEFKMMDGSYCQAATAEIDNFHIIMGQGAGLYVSGNTEWGAQADADQNRITLKAGATEAYLKLGGVATIQKHKYGMVIGSGVNYAINSFRILEGGNVVTQEYLIEKGDQMVPVYVFEGIEAESYGALTVTADTTKCGASWNKTQEEFEGRIIGEDLNAGAEKSDFDFNDVVFDYKYVTGGVKIRLLAAGGTLPLRLNGDDVNYEVHKLFGLNNTKTMVNTGIGNKIEYPIFTITGSFDPSKKGYDIKLEVQKGDANSENGGWIEMTAEKGKAASKVRVGTDYDWCAERQDIDLKYFGVEDQRFSKYVKKIGGYKWNTWYIK